MDKAELTEIFDKYCKKLRIVPAWDVKLEFVEDPSWRKTGDFKVDCEDKKAVFLLNAVNPKQENLEEIIVHELMHLKMYPLDQVTESLITSTFEEGTPASNFAYRQFFSTLEQTVEYGFWEAYDADHTIIRFASSWATTMQDVQALGECLKTLAAFR